MRGRRAMEQPSMRFTSTKPGVRNSRCVPMIKRTIPRLLSLILPFVFIAIVSWKSTLIASAQVATGQIVVPARGLFSLKDGTVETWVKFDFEPTSPVTGYTARGQLFLFRVPKAEND